MKTGWEPGNKVILDVTALAGRYLEPDIATDPQVQDR